MKFLYLSALLCFFTLMGNAQNQPEQNCINGIPVCQSGYSQSNTYLGPGTIIELNSTNQGCLLSGEVNCVWYIIQVSVSGQLALSITPNNLSNDYDFAVWNITANGCQDIYNGTPPIACNYSGNAGATGLSSTNMGAQWSPTISVTAGQTLALNVSNFSQTNQSGYVLNFTASTASIFDNVPPSFSTAAVPCGYAADSLDVTISESVKCSSIASNGSNFSLLSGAPGTTVPAGTTIVSATGLNCSPNTTLTRTIRLKFSAPLPPGTYKLKPKLGTAGTTLQDPCNNNVITGASADSVIFTMTPPLTRLYVDSAATTSGTGESWASPLKSLNAALALANTGCANEIWVRKGTYFPMESATTIASSRDSSFRILRNGVKLYGGFAGTETALSQRNLTLNTTTLSGDIGTPGVATDNAKHVVTVLAPAGSTFNATTLISGFTITGGNANVGTGTPTFTYNGLPVSGNNGGGIFCGANGSGSAVNMLIEDCLISGNYAEGGGGLYSSGSAPVALHCTFAQNTTNLQGGALFVSAGIFTSNNCVFAGNSAAAVGSVAHIAAGSTAAFNNSTLYNGSPFTGVALSNAGTAALNNTILWGANAAQVTGGGVLNAAYSDVIGIAAAGTNISANPQFVSPASAIGPDGIWGTTDDGLRLTPCSPAINAGSNALLPAGITTDFTGAPRIQSTAVEMGAYEMPFSVLPPSVTSISRSPAGTVCGNTPIVFTATTVPAGGGATYQWFKNGVAVGTAQSTYTFSSWSNGDAVWVVNTNSTCGGSDTSAKEIIPVTPSPQQPGVITGNVSPCPGAHTYSVVAVPGATVYTWTVPAGWIITSGQGTNTIMVTSNSTSGNVTVFANNSCLVASTVRTLAVTSFTTPVMPSGPTIVCASSAGNVYSIPPVPGATGYTWTVPAGWIITSGQGSANIVVTAPAGNTSGLVTVNASNGCPTGTLPLPVTGSSAPTLIVGSNSGDTICTGTLVVFTATPINGGTLPLYQWKKNGVPVGTNSPTYSTASLVNGDVVSVVFTSNSPCATTPTITSFGPPIVVVPYVVPAISINGLQSLVLCAGATATFTTSTTASGLAPMYQWYKNGIPLPSATGYSYTGSGFANGDSLSVLLTSSVRCRSVDTVRSNSVKLNVYPNVVPAVTVTASPGLSVPAGSSVTFTATVTQTNATPAYQWFKNAVAITGANSSTYTTNTLTSGDLITVSVSALGPCANPNTVVSAPLQISSPAGIATVGRRGSWQESLSLFPNPSSGQFTIAADWSGIAAGEQVEIEVLNNLGQAVFKKRTPLNAAKWSLAINLAERVANGLYTLRLVRQKDGSYAAVPLLIQR